jgi:hypothetical protein
MISWFVFSTIKIENTVITYFIQFTEVCKGKPRGEDNAQIKPMKYYSFSSFCELYFDDLKN